MTVDPTTLYKLVQKQQASSGKDDFRFRVFFFNPGATPLNDHQPAVLLGTFLDVVEVMHGDLVPIDLVEDGIGQGVSLANANALRTTGVREGRAHYMAVVAEFKDPLTDMVVWYGNCSTLWAPWADTVIHPGRLRLELGNIAS